MMRLIYLYLCISSMVAVLVFVAAVIDSLLKFLKDYEGV